MSTPKSPTHSTPTATDQYIATVDLQDFFVHYGQEFEPGELLVDSIPLSAYLEAMEALILANAMPAGTNPGQFLRWNGDGWELVMPKVGCNAARGLQLR